MAFPKLHSIIILSSPDSISIKAITHLGQIEKKKRLTALEIVIQSEEGRFIAGKTLFLIYVDHISFPEPEKKNPSFH